MKTTQQYHIRTDAVMESILAVDRDEAARLFAASEALDGVTDEASLIAAYDAIGDGAYVVITEA